MIQVKEFLNYQNQEKMVNDFLKEKGNSIEIVDIKYSVGSCGKFNQAYSGILIVYKEN